MKSRTRASSTLLLALLTAPVAAQEKPNFSGRWSVPAPEARGAGAGDARAAGAGARSGQSQRGDMGSGWGSTITIEHQASRLSVEYAFFGRGDMQPPLKFVYALDGTETKNSVMLGRGIQMQTSKTSWNGNSLIITTLHTFNHPATGQPATSEVVRTVTLQSADSLIVETVRSPALGGPEGRTRTVYVKN
jgi:hypothetical protein